MVAKASRIEFQVIYKSSAKSAKSNDDNEVSFSPRLSSAQLGSVYRALQFAFQEEAEEADVEAVSHSPTWPDMARHSLFSLPFLVIPGQSQTVRAPQCRMLSCLVQFFSSSHHNIFGKHMFEQCLFKFF